MDPAGRLVIPAEIRREAAIAPGTPLDVRYYGPTCAELAAPADTCSDRIV